MIAIAGSLPVPWWAIIALGLFVAARSWHRWLAPRLEQRREMRSFDRMIHRPVPSLPQHKRG